MLSFLMSFSPAFILIAAGILCAFMPSSRVRKAVLIFAPALALVMIEAVTGSVPFAAALSQHPLATHAVG